MTPARGKCGRRRLTCRLETHCPRRGVPVPPENALWHSLAPDATIMGMKHTLLGLALLAFVGCSDDDATAPTPEAPISSVTLTQLGADSLLVTFTVTQSYGVAVLRTRSATTSYSPIASIPPASAQEFRTRWTDWIFPTDTFGWVAVELGFGANNTERYVRIQQFTPAP